MRVVSSLLIISFIRVPLDVIFCLKSSKVWLLLTQLGVGGLSSQVRMLKILLGIFFFSFFVCWSLSCRVILFVLLLFPSLGGCFGFVVSLILLLVLLLFFLCL